MATSILQIEGLAAFRNLDDGSGSIEIPESPENRKSTNVKWLIILGVIILAWLPLVSYTLYYSDISRITAGYDKCGNVCGKKNFEWEGISCSGQDFTDLPYMEITHMVGGQNDSYRIIEEKRCIQSCKEGYIEIFGGCHLEDDIPWYVLILSVLWQLTVSVLLSILVTMGMLFLFRYAGAFMIWGILIGTLVLLIILAAVFWFMYSNDSRMEHFVGGIISTILLVIYGIMFIWCLKRIPLVILILKETTQAVFAMPGLIAIAILNGFVILILTVIFIILTLYLLSAGTLEETMYEFDTYEYVKDGVMFFTFYYNICVYLLLLEFFIDIEYMIIAGAVAKWYFARDKSNLGSPILTSISNAFKFHLGTAALGAIIINLIRIIKSLICRKQFTGNSCLNFITRILKYLSKNAYIVTVLHGQPFVKSGKRAAKLLFYNLGDMVALNFISSWVVFVAKVLIVLVSGWLSLAVLAIVPGPILNSVVLGFLVVSVFAMQFASIVFGVLDTGIDTIFICYCEDKILNDGIARPYFMSRNLMEFIEKSKAAYGIE